MTAECIFCGATPTTNEHIIPQWLGEYVLSTKPEATRPDHIVKSVHRRVSRGHGTDSSNEWLADSTPDFRVNCVCRDCNGGWMSGIEVGAKTVLLRLIKDQPGALDIDEQNAVARWLSLKAILAKYAKPLLYQDEGWAEQFYVERSPPRTWQVRVGRAVLNAGNPIFFATTPYDAHFRSLLDDREIAIAGFSFVIAVGSFAGQVLGSRQDAAIPINTSYFSQIWPHPLLGQGISQSDLSAAWPPTVPLNEDQLYECSQNPAGPARTQ